MDASSEKVLISLPPAGKSPLHGSTSFPKVSCSSVPCLIHALRQFLRNFQWVLSRLCSLRAIASRTALLRVRSVLEGQSFPNLKSFPYDWPASACLCPHVDQTRLPCTCSSHVWTSVLIRFWPVCLLLASPCSMAAGVSLNFPAHPFHVSSTRCLSFPKFPMGPLKIVPPAHHCHSNCASSVALCA